jgi:hypothetical protein
MVKFVLGLLVAAQSMAAPLLTDKELALTPGQNLMVNPGFEAGTSNWTASGGTFGTNTTAANVGKGKIAGSWDSSAASQTLTSSAFTLPAGMYSRNAVASCLIKGSGATHKLQAYDGTSVLAEAQITSASTYTRSVVTFTMPSSGSIRLRLASVAADEPVIYVDDCMLGDPLSVGVIPSSALYWAGNHGNDCTFSKSGASYGDFDNDASCTFTETQNFGFGTVTTYGSTRPGVVWTPTQTGRYFVMATILAAGDVNQEGYSYQLKSGSTVISTQDLTTKGSAGAAYVTGMTLAGILNISSLAELNVHIEGYAGSGSVYIGPTGGTSGQSVVWTIYSLNYSAHTGSVSSASSGLEKIERASIANNGTASITSQSGWLTSATRNNLGEVTLAVSPAFASLPTCVVSVSTGNASYATVYDAGSTSSSIKIYTYSSAVASIDSDFSIICMGPK